MPVDTAGNCSRPPSPIPVSGQDADAPQVNIPIDDIYSILNLLVFLDGRKPMRGDLPMNGRRVTGLGTGVEPGDAATVGQVKMAGVPIGSIIDFAGVTAPDGYLLCFGQEVSRSEYADLFGVIGTSYGEGDGAATFNVPDCRDVARVGKGNMGGTAKGLLSKFASTVLGSIFGVQEHKLTVAQMPSHSHTGTANTAGAHSHSLTRSLLTGSGGDGAQWGNNISGSYQTTVNGAHSHSLSINGTGGDQAHPNVQPSIVFNVIIKAREV